MSSQTLWLTISIIVIYFMHASFAQSNNTTTTMPTTGMTTTDYYTTLTPTVIPTGYPTTAAPTYIPTADPVTTTGVTTIEPTYDPTMVPTQDPTYDPTMYPTYDPTYDPTYYPTYHPTYHPTYYPTYYPTYDPTMDPTYDPTADPTMDPTADPTTEPTNEPTNEPTIEPTTEPTFEPTFNPTTYPTKDPTTSSPTTAPVTTTTKKKKWRVFCRIIFRIWKYLRRIRNANAAEETPITDEEVTDIVKLTIQDNVDAELEFDVITLTKSDDANNTNITIYQYDLEILVADEEDATLLQETIESSEFEAALIEQLETESDREVDVSEAVVVSIEEIEEECKSTLYKPWTYCPGQILPWILLGAAACILLVLCVCLVRCLYLCCTRARRRTGRKSKYEVGGAMFAPIDSVNAEQESAFQSDLRTAIEMNKKGKLLKTADSHKSLDLDGDAVATAFDMNFDEIKPINGGNANGANGAKQQQIKKAASADSAASDDQKDQDKNKKEEKRKPKGSEGAMPETTGMTPGGPTPGGPDDEDNPPPAPAPPIVNMQDVDDYDLL